MATSGDRPVGQYIAYQQAVSKGQLKDESINKRFPHMRTNLDRDFGFVNKQKIRDGYLEMIVRFEPTIWATLTFSRQVTQYEQAKKLTRKFFNMINVLAQRQLVNNRISMLACFEKHKIRDMKEDLLHVHGFIKGINPQFSNMVEEFAEKKLGYAKIKPYDPRKKASIYVSEKFGTKHFIEFEPLTIHPKPYNPNFKKSKFLYSRRVISKSKMLT